MKPIFTFPPPRRRTEQGFHLRTRKNCPNNRDHRTIQYATEGTQSSGGMNRGRLLAAMDAELAAALKREPHITAKMNVAPAEAGPSATTMGTNVFWADPVFGSTKTVDKRLERITTV